MAGLGRMTKNSILKEIAIRAPGRIRTCAHGLGNHCSIP